MRKVLPSHIEEHFLRNGFVRHAVGGVIPTDAGQYAYMMWQKGGVE